MEQRTRKINIGCGHDKRDGYVNVDVDPSCNPDYLVKDHDLSIFPDGSFDEVLAWDVLEHIPHAFTMSAVLDWAALLSSGGILVLQTSSILGVSQQMLDNPSFETEFNWTRCLFGNQQHGGDFHHTGFTTTTLSTYLRAAGFDVGPITTLDGWLLSCRAVKTHDWTELLSRAFEDMISTAFRTVLRRDIDADTLQHYVGSKRNGESSRSLLKGIISAPEHLYKLGKETGFDPWP